MTSPAPASSYIFQEVLHWFLNVVTSDLRKHYAALLPSKGAVVVRWTEQVQGMHGALG